MCRSIRTLYNFEPPATQHEIEGAALQYVRKVSGMAKPSLVNQPVVDAAIAEIVRATQKLFDSLKTTANARDREVEAEKAKMRIQKRLNQ